MALAKLNILAEKYPELAQIAEDFDKLKEINKEKIIAVKQYLKTYDEGSMRQIVSAFKRLQKLVFEDKNHEKSDRKYALHLLNRITDQPVKTELSELIKGLERLSNILSEQLELVNSDVIMWRLRTDFHHFMQLIREEQKIIEGDADFLDEIKEHYTDEIIRKAKTNAKNVENIGHRGARGLYPENTIGSMQAALDAGAKMIEFDVQPCSSGEIVIMHDYTVDRTTNGHGKIKDLSWQYLSKLHIKGTTEGIPTLYQVLKRFSKKCDMNIELKVYKTTHKETLFLVKNVLSIVSSNSSQNRIIFSSFNSDIQAMLKRQLNRFSNRFSTAFLPVDPGESLWWGIQHLFRYKLYHSRSKKIKRVSRRQIHKYLIRKTLALGAKAVHPTLDIIDEELIKIAHEKGLKVNVWVVNDPFMMMRFIYWGVDGIITDRPDILAKVKKSFLTKTIPNLDKLTSKEKFSWDVPAKVAEIPKTQPKHVDKTA